MPQNENYSIVDLPEGLRRQFELAGQRLWRVETITAVCAIAASLVLSWLALFISDRLWATPVWLRLLLFLCGLAGATAAGLFWARNWVWRRRDLEAMATLVQRKYRRLGDRLLGIVELATEREHLANFSPALYHAAIAQVAEEAQKFDFRKSVNARPARNFGWSAAGLSLCLLAASLALPQASWNAFARWIQPVANVPRYTLVALDGFPQQLIVAHGEPFEISGSVHYRSFWKPSRVLDWFSSETSTETSVHSGKVRLQIAGRVENGVLNVRVGDALAQVTILPNHRPSLQQLFATVHLPEYLRYPDQFQPVQSGAFRTLDGSQVSFIGTVSRLLATASMRGGGQDSEALQVQGATFSSGPAATTGAEELVFNWRDELGLSNSAPWRLSIQQESDQPPQPDLPDQPREVAMLVSDVMRIRAEATDDFGVRALGLAWDVVSDKEMPESMTTEIKAEMTSARQSKVEDTFIWSPKLYNIPADCTVELQGFARDYYPKRQSARTGSYVIRVLSPESHAEILRQQLEALMARIDDVTRLQETIASETRDVRESSTNLTGAQEAARLTQSQDEQLQNAQRLAELSQQGENVVREAVKNPVIPEDTIRQWAKTVQQWQDLASDKMQDAARAMQTAARDAQSKPSTPNPASTNQSPQSPGSTNSQSQPTQNAQSGSTNSQSQPSQNAQSGSTNSQSQQSQNSQSQPSPNSQPQQSQNSQSQQAQNSQSQPQDAKAQEEEAKRLEQELADAQKRAEEVLAALRKMEQNANQQLDQLQALTLAERLRRVGDEEKGLGMDLTTNMADTVGLPPEELPDKFKLLNASFVKKQGGARDESTALQAEISRFFERTQMPTYGKVSQDMKDSAVADELDRMGTLIQSNITMQTSVDLTNWSGRFQKWADDLQPKSDSQGGQAGSGGQGQPPLDLTKQLIALLRLREKESTLRDQTGILEWTKDISADYKEQAASLATTQDNLGQALDLIHKATPVPELNPPFEEVASSMKEAGQLLAKPETGAVTEGTETRTVDELSDLINLVNEKAQRSQQQQQQQQQEQAGSASAEEMAFLTAMMRASNQNGPPSTQPPGPGGTGRGNFSGGTTDNAGHPVAGGAGGRSGVSRRVNQAAGAIQNSPVEFRDALENYFHNVEKPRN